MPTRDLWASLLIATLLLHGCSSSAAIKPTEPPKSTCLVLSVGGPAGIAQLGAIETLRETGVDVSCVVGNSMGSLVGALYAADPTGDTTAHVQAIMNQYVQATKDEATTAAATGGLLGLLFLGPLGGLVGGVAGATSIDRLEHKRLVRVLDGYLGGRSIEQLSLPYETSYVQQAGSKVALLHVKTGNVAAAVGASVANPIIFNELDVRQGGPIDPGLDRVAAIPIEHACESFPDRIMLVINVTQERAFVSTGMNCSTFEIRPNIPPLPPEAILTSPEAFQQVVESGRLAADAWLQSVEGRQYLSLAKRSTAQPYASRHPSHD